MDDFLPVPDICTQFGCGRPKVDHTRWPAEGVNHTYVPEKPKPRPERIASSFIQTTWACTHCGAACDVWGVCDGEWMLCDECDKYSFVLFTLESAPSKRMEQ